MGVFPRQSYQHHETRLPLDERGDVRVRFPCEEVAFPVTRDGAVVDAGWALPDGHRIDDLPAGLTGRRRKARSTHGLSTAEVSEQRLLQHASALHEQAQVDRLMRHLHIWILGIGPLKPARDLLWRPIGFQLLRDAGAQRRMLRESTDLRP